MSSPKNDLLFVVESDKKEALNQKQIEKLINEFKEELRPIGIACKTWGKC